FAYHDRVGTGEGVGHTVDTAGLVVAFGEIADNVALSEGSMNPVDKRAAVLLIHGTGGAHDKDRTTIDIGVVDSHRGMQKPDDVMDDGHHWFTAGLGVAMGN